jgi:cytochrome c oxidase cbb3-type subunit 4
MIVTNLSAHAGMIGLLFFFVFFVGLLIWVFRPGSKKNYDAKAQIPLKDDNDE